MEIEKVKEFIQTIVLPGASEAIARNGSLMPVSFLLYEDGQFGMAAMEGGFANDLEKVVYSQTVNKLALGPDGLPPCQAVVYLAEGWYQDVLPENLAAWRKQHGRPSADPNRKEAVFIWYTTAQKEWGMQRVPIIRQGEDVSLGTDDVLDDPTGFYASDEMPNPWHVTGLAGKPGVLA